MLGEKYSRDLLSTVIGAEKWPLCTLLIRQSGPEIMEDAEDVGGLGTVGNLEALGSKTTSVFPRS